MVCCGNEDSDGAKRTKLRKSVAKLNLIHAKFSNNRSFNTVRQTSSVHPNSRFLMLVFFQEKHEAPRSD